MMTARTFRAAWGEEHLFLFSVDDLSAVDIPVSSKLFLTEGGMPRQALLPSNSYGLHLLPPEAPAIVLPGGDEFRLLEERGCFWLLAVRWYRCLIALDQKGQIVTGSDEGVCQGTVGLMNSSLAQFAEVLLICRTSRERFWGRWPSDYTSFLKMSKSQDYTRFEIEALSETEWLEDELRRVDPVAMARPNSYWPGVIEDLKQI